MTWGWALVRPVPITAAMLAPANPRVDYPRYSTPADWNMGTTGNDIDGCKATVAAVGSESTLATGYPAALTQTARNALKVPALAAPSDIGQDYGAYDNLTGRAGFIGPLDPYPDATSPTKLNSVVPGTGTTAGGTTVTLAGVGFTGATAVTFGGTAGTSIVVGTPNSLTVVTPAKTAGSYDVLVTSPRGTSQAGVKYTYV
jgi:hypothetical protein